MSEKTNGVNWNKSSGSRKRRKAVISRLENQLTKGTKEGVPLTEKDIIRINKEIETLKTRI